MIDKYKTKGSVREFLFMKSAHRTKTEAWEAVVCEQHWSLDRLEKGCVGDGPTVVNGLRLLWKKTDSWCLEYSRVAMAPSSQ